MAKTFWLDIITPDRIVYSQEVNMVIARAIDGDIGILPGHSPLITALDIWPLRIQREDSEALVAISGGFMEVQPEKVTILASCAELPEEIDVRRAQAAKERAECRLKEDSSVDRVRAESAMRRSGVRLQVASGRHVGKGKE